MQRNLDENLKVTLNQVRSCRKDYTESHIDGKHRLHNTDEMKCQITIWKKLDIDESFRTDLSFCEKKHISLGELKVMVVTALERKRPHLSTNRAPLPPIVVFPT